MRYLVTLKPVGNYFFGGEVTLGDGTTQNYNVSSNSLPQAASLLGLMRYEILRQNNLLSYDASNKEVLGKVKKLIGEGGFSLSEKEERESFGILKGLSPVFLYKPSKDRYYTVERVDISQRGADEKVKHTVSVRTSSENRCSYSVEDRMEGQEKEEGWMTQIQIPSFDAKKQDYNTYWCDNEWNRIPNPFTFVEQIGITKNEKKDNEKDAFFKQKMVRLDPSLCMAFTVDVVEGNNIAAEKHWVYLGGNRSLFEMTIQQTDIDFRTYFKTLHQEGSLLALGDAFLPDEDKRKCLFVWGECEPCRYMENQVNQKHSWKKPKKSSMYHLQKRGSVIYANAEILRRLQNCKFQNLGLNIFI
ncbi:type III-B CRISPR module-associated Cmr3 family protein [Parabacteroides sp.]|uniref:type III-B CRISPR module-associated Cmr3 family protein n=1 Tax=Parabacteroides sp. TaxID=1869337 RepID=UPI00257F1D03|nr:type III-B CRISPR module-associated Cmr3 family protein [Parabacteroides sp.]